ncbi:MAG: flagellin, partial [Synergistaceae bacterium]|nr:flagellin [Synergistaceae bacterium]
MMIGSNNTINMTYNALTATNKAIEKTARALSTGQRAATAADDAAGFAIGAGLSAQVAGVDRAIRNTQDGISLLQTAEGGLNQINSMLQRMRELTVQAANDTLTSQDREYMQLEIDELRNNIDNVAKNTTFNTKRLLDGSSAANWTSDNDTTKLRVTGAVTEFDQFGQKKTAAGNYRIEIRAKAGQGQIQKTSIMDLTIAEEYTRTETLTDSDG